jgi:hypothetical protein
MFSPQIKREQQAGEPGILLPLRHASRAHTVRLQTIVTDASDL